MIQPFPREHELISFFGVVPEYTDADIPKNYSEATFETGRGGRIVSFSVSQMEYVAKIEISGDQGPELLLDLHGVKAIRLSDHPRLGTSMVIEMTDPKLNSVRLSLDPVPSIAWGTKLNPDEPSRT